MTNTSRVRGVVLVSISYSEGSGCSRPFGRPAKEPWNRSSGAMFIMACRMGFSRVFIPT